MTSPSSAASYSSIGSTRRESVAKRSSKTFKSIQKYCPRPDPTTKSINTSTSPVLLHSVNEDLFPRLWSFLAEVMVVEGELSSTCKEAIARRVHSSSSRRSINKINTPRRRLPRRSKSSPSSSPPANKKEMTLEQKRQAARDTQALHLTEQLLLRPNAINLLPFPLLSQAAKAEVALVVLLFQHLNRSMTAILGEQRKSAAMMNASFRPSSSEAEATCSGVRSVVQGMMANFGVFKRSSSKTIQPGITSSLFSSETLSNTTLASLPKHLLEAGDEPALALSRLAAWVETYEASKVVSPNILQLLDSNHPAFVPPATVLQSYQMAQWLTIDLPGTSIFQSMFRGKAHQEEDVARLLLSVQYSPESVAKSTSWLEVRKALGKDAATTLVLWWSLRLTLAEAQGLGGSATTTAGHWKTNGKQPRNLSMTSRTVAEEDDDISDDVYC